jgi:type IV secretory pathway TraG/TraD family ATPase VirD4
MTTQQIGSSFDRLTHGWHAVLLIYGIIAVCSLAGLKRGGARLEQYLLWPLTSLATTVVAFIVLAVLGELAGHLGFKPPTAIETIIGFAAWMLAGVGGGLYWATRARAFKPAHARGAVVFDGAWVQKETRRFIKSAAGEGVLTLAGVAVNAQDETKHFKFMGTTGSGKSTALRELLHGALQRGDRAVIADPDGTYLSQFYSPRRGDVILNPFDRRSPKWDLFAELQQPYDIDQLARALIPDRGNADPTWTSYARTFFGAIVRQARALQVKDLGELYRILTVAERQELKLLTQGTAAAPFLEEGNDRFFGSVRSATTENTKSLEYICQQHDPPFPVRQWIRRGKGVLFLPYQADQIVALKSIISTWMRLAIFQTLSLGEGDWRLWFAVDELDALGPIDGLADALPRLRKFGGRCALGFQSISQVSNTYGQGLAQAMVENCGTSLILRCSASEHGDNSQFASKLIGDRQIVRMSQSVSRSAEGFLGRKRDTHGTTEQHAVEAAVMPAEIEQLADRSGFLKFPSQAEWLKLSFPYFELPKIAEPFVPT